MAVSQPRSYDITLTDPATGQRVSLLLKQEDRDVSLQVTNRPGQYVSASIMDIQTNVDKYYEALHTIVRDLNERVSRATHNTLQVSIPPMFDYSSGHLALRYVEKSPTQLFDTLYHSLQEMQTAYAPRASKPTHQHGGLDEALRQLFSFVGATIKNPEGRKANNRHELWIEFHIPEEKHSNSLQRLYQFQEALAQHAGNSLPCEIISPDAMPGKGPTRFILKFFGNHGEEHMPFFGRMASHIKEALARCKQTSLSGMDMLKHVVQNDFKFLGMEVAANSGQVKTPKGMMQAVEFTFKTTALQHDTALAHLLNFQMALDQHSSLAISVTGQDPKQLNLDPHEIKLLVVGNKGMSEDELCTLVANASMAAIQSLDIGAQLRAKHPKAIRDQDLATSREMGLKSRGRNSDIIRN